MANKFRVQDGIVLANGSIIEDTSTTTVITPPGALAGQSLVIRPTGATGIVSDHPGGFTDGDTITLTVTPDYNFTPVTGTVDYTFTGATSQQLGRALTGTLTFTSETAKPISWTIPVSSTMTTFTITLSNASGFDISTIAPLTLTSNGSSEDHHVHLIAGDPSITDIYLGDDDQYVKIEKNAGNVVIGTDTNTKQWKFGTDGELTLPGNVKSTDVAEVGQIITCMGLLNVPSQYKLFNTVTFTGGVYSDIQVGWAVSNGEGWTATVTAIDDPAPGFITIDNDWDAVDDKLVSFTSPDYQAATSEDLILTSDNSSLTLSANGNLTLPNSGGVIKSTASSTIINGAYKSFTISTGAYGPGPGYSGNGLWVAITPETEQIQAGWTCTFSDSATVFTVTSVGYSSGNFSINFDGQTDNVVFPMVANSPTSSIKLQPVSGGSTWTFSGNGTTIFPGDLIGSGASPAPSLSGFSSVSALEFKNGTSNVTVNSNSNLWKFDSTGNLTIPGSSGGFIKTVSNASIGIAAVDNGTNNPAQLMSFNVTANAPTSIISAYATNATIQTNATGTMKTWSFDNVGNLTLPGNTFSVNYANGTQVSLGGGSSYGNSNVATFLASYGSNTITTTGNVSVGNIGANAGVFTGNVTANNFSGNISITGNVTGTSPNVTLVAGSYSYTFDNTGILTLPSTSIGSGNEGGEIDFTKAPNSTLSGNSVVIDQYLDRIRFFESGGNVRGAYIDLSQAATGVGTLLNNRASGVVNAGVDVILGNLKARIPTSGNRSLQVSTVSGTYSVTGSSTYSQAGVVSGVTIQSIGPRTINTTPAYLNPNYNFSTDGSTDTWTIYDATNVMAWRITMILGASFLNNLISIERLV